MLALQRREERQLRLHACKLTNRPLQESQKFWGTPEAAVALIFENAAGFKGW